MHNHNKKTILDKGKLKRVSKDTVVDFTFPDAGSLFSLPTNLSPNLQGISGGRVLLSSKAPLQATSLVHREEPLIQSVSKKGDKSFNSIIGSELMSVKAKEAGTVKSITKDEIVVGDVEYPIFHNFGFGRKNFIHHDVTVKVGDKVHKGDLLATSNYTDSKGNLALGVNLTTAIMPLRMGGNFEDSWTITESGAKKLTAEQMLKYQVEKKLGIEIDKNKYISLFANRFYNTQLNNIDSGGIVKVGTVVKKGDPLILALSPKSLKSTDIALGKLSKILKYAFTDQAQVWDYEHEGVVTDTVNTPAFAMVNVKTKRGMSVGSKLSNAFGAKGIVHAIMPDSHAPTLSDGSVPDIFLNTMSVVSRVAPALPIVLAIGKLAKKQGKPINIEQFTPGSMHEDAAKLLRDNHISEHEVMYDPKTGREIRAMVGPLYYNRLDHTAEDKISVRTQGRAYTIDMQPGHSSEESAKRFGNLSTTALLSHGALSTLEDIGSIKSTKNDEYWRALKLGQPLPALHIPFIFNKFIASLQGAGVKVNHHGTKYNVLPMKDSDITKMSGGEIKEPLTFKVKADKLVPEVGGLFDTGLTGLMGERYNHITLNHSVPNPISEEYLRRLLGVTQKEYERMVTSGEAVAKIEALKLDVEEDKYKKYLKSGKKTEKDNAIKNMHFIRTLKKNGITAKDLILNHVPIIPAQYRPEMVQGDLIISSDVNTLYKDLMLNNASLKNTVGVPDEVISKLKKAQYDSIKAVFGLGDPVSTKSKEKGIKGLLASSLGISGGSAKSTMFQSKVINKPIDLVGRAVLNSSAHLDIDQASIPQDLVWKLYAPFVIRRLVQRGIPAVQAHEYVEKRNSLALEELHKELEHRPAIINRDPAWFKYNLTGFKIRPNVDPKDHTTYLNPLILKSMGGDEDGDQVGISVPIGEKAVAEIKNKMMPSKNLLHHKNMLPIYVPSNEAALGLYEASVRNNKKIPKKYKTEQAVVDAFNQGKLDVGDQVEID